MTASEVTRSSLSLSGGYDREQVSSLPIFDPGAVPRITSLLIKPASAVCNLDCEYCFYLDREADPYTSLPGRRMTVDTLERLVERSSTTYPNSVLAFQGGEPTLAGLPFFEKLVEFEQRFGRPNQTVATRAFYTGR